MHPREIHSSQETEHHVHNVALLYGNDGAGNIELRSPTPFVLDASGALPSMASEALIHDGTVLGGGDVKVDPGTLHVRGTTDANALYLIELWAAPQGSAFGDAEQISSWVFEEGSVAPQTPKTPVHEPSKRVPANWQMWARAGVEGATGGETISVVFIMHFYPAGI